MAHTHAPTPMTPEPPSVEREIENREEQDWSRVSRKADQRIQSHDAAGFETELSDFSGYDDGYGNNVAHGDLTIQRMTEQSREAVLNQPCYVRPYDTEPFQSRAQARMMHAHEGEPGYMSKAQVKEFDESTDFSKLPERK